MNWDKVEGDKYINIEYLVNSTVLQDGNLECQINKKADQVPIEEHNNGSNLYK
uniref:Uncharacterized protein n=1 Tax=Arion vulgaris TaxID=1028688 RepID=A0A0B7A7L6_9EUPU